MAVLYTVDADVGRLPGQILADLHEAFARRLRAAAREVRPRAREAVRRALGATPEYGELLGGRLRTEFGLEFPARALRSIAAAIEAAVEVVVVPPDGEYLGGLFVGAFRDDFSDALSAEGAEYVSVNAAGRGLPVPWLSWLLFAGDAVVLAGHGVVRVPADLWSRSGRAIMVARGRGSRLQPWRVPPAFAGTAEDNWLVRASLLAGPPVLRLLEEQARRFLS